MLVSLLKLIQGYLKIRITGYSPERFLNLCKSKNISTWGLEATRNGYEMYIKVSGFRKIKPILRKTKTKVEILERFGLPFFFHKYRKRKLFFTGIIASMLLVYVMTFFIWNIDLQGNRAITDDVFMEYLESQHISHGMAKHKVDCEQIAKDIRKNFDDIIWVSVSLQGTRLFIHVKENTDTFEKQVESNEPSDIIADKSGVVMSIITRNGTPKVTVGDEVEAGDVLVSGTIEVLNDAKEVAGYRYVKSDADIVLQTIMEYDEYISKQYMQKIYTKKERTLFFVSIGTYTVELGLKKNSYKLWEQQSEEMQIKIEENFYLPVSIGKKIIMEYELKTMEYSNAELEKLLNEKFDCFCNKLESNKAIILDKKLEITHDKEGAKGSASLTLHETVGIQREIVDFLQVPMLEYNGL